MTTLNLLARESGVRVVRQRSNAATTAAGCLVAALAAGPVVWEYRALGAEEATLTATLMRASRADGRRAPAEPAAALSRRDELAARVSAIEQQRHDDMTAVRVLAHVGRSLPGDVWLTQLAWQDGALSLAGLGLTHAVVAEFLENLGQGDLFAGPVELVGADFRAADREAGGRDAIEFSIRAHVHGSRRAARIPRSGPRAGSGARP